MILAEICIIALPVFIIVALFIYAISPVKSDKERQIQTMWLIGESGTLLPPQGGSVIAPPQSVSGVFTYEEEMEAMGDSPLRWGFTTLEVVNGLRAFYGYTPLAEPEYEEIKANYPE